MDNQITLTKTHKVTISFDTNNLKVISRGSRDNDSFKLDILYDDVEIGNGHINFRSNTAHITLEEQNEHLEDIIVELIENEKTLIIF